jgi:hypothetical protein
MIEEQHGIHLIDVIKNRRIADGSNAQIILPEVVPPAWATDPEVRQRLTEIGFCLVEVNGRLRVTTKQAPPQPISDIDAEFNKNHREMSQEQFDKWLADKYPPPPKEPEPVIPAGAIITAQLEGPIICQPLRRHPGQFAACTLAVAKASDQLASICPLPQDQLFSDFEMGPSYVLGGVEEFEEKYTPSTWDYNSCAYRTAFRPLKWYLPASVIKFTKAYALGRKILMELRNPGTGERQRLEMEAQA